MSPAPSLIHETLVAHLETLGRLSGHSLPLDGRLPDGTRPDVVLADPDSRSLFLGDAKVSETGRNHGAAVRLRHYLRTTEACPPFPRLLAVAVPDVESAASWQDALHLILDWDWPVYADGLESGVHVVWAALPGPLGDGRDHVRRTSVRSMTYLPDGRA